MTSHAYVGVDPAEPERDRTVRTIYCPGPDMWVPIGAYMKAVRMAKDHPDMEFSTGLTTWWPTTGEEIVRQFRRGLHDRINQAVPYHRRGL